MQERDGSWGAGDFSLAGGDMLFGVAALGVDLPRVEFGANWTAKKALHGLKCQEKRADTFSHRKP